jgi:hypothetical protein
MLLVAALLMQGVAGRATAMCIGTDHLEFSGRNGHACCDHDDDAAQPASHLSASDSGCGCIDITLPSSPMQTKRLSVGPDFDATHRCTAPFEMKAFHLSAPSRALWRVTDRRDPRSVVLLI